MFTPNSRYSEAGTYEVELPNGQRVKATRLPAPGAARVRGFHRRLEGQRLDLLANHYLRDATTFWRLCDANDSISPDALGARDKIGVPRLGK